MISWGFIRADQTAFRMSPSLLTRRKQEHARSSVGRSETPLNHPRPAEGRRAARMCAALASPRARAPADAAAGAQPAQHARQPRHAQPAQSGEATRPALPLWRMGLKVRREEEGGAGGWGVKREPTARRALDDVVQRRANDKCLSAL